MELKDFSLKQMLACRVNHRLVGDDGAIIRTPSGWLYVFKIDFGLGFRGVSSVHVGNSEQYIPYSLGQPSQ